MTELYCGDIATHLKVGMPLSALIPAPDRTTMFLALDKISLKARMSLDGPSSLFSCSDLAASELELAIIVYVITKITAKWKWSSRP